MKTIALAALAMMAFWVATVDAQTARYTDERGTVHYVGSPNQVPEQYRAKATTPSLDKRPIQANGPDRVPGSSDPAGEAAQEDPAQTDDP